MHEPGNTRSGWNQAPGNRPLDGSEFNEADLDSLFAELKAPEEFSPAPGFYARVMDRIESQRSNSIWSVFLEPIFGRRLAMASAVLMLLLAAALFVPGSESEDGLIAQSNISVVSDKQPAPVLASLDGQDKDAVLVDLVTYQEH